MELLALFAAVFSKLYGTVSTEKAKSHWLVLLSEIPARLKCLQ